ncbi:General secretion pathway M protein [Desulfosarcina cetonica]|uniref:type II secretion system protein GspM n=1 Tax=Desulfosarcina cetonica TaxID=90730 RepID=UPI0006D0CC81|nr:type II secretion system protein GspM [Desulfosarcina cetonica]VTR65129.1 General secretion pathway M protein [Desulfosarcina cetonica]
MAVKLNKREKISVAAAGSVIVLFVFLQFVVFPLLDKNTRLEQTILTREKELAEISLLQAQYRQTADKSKQMQDHLKSRRRGFTLFSFLESLARRTGVKSQIAYMKPTSVPMKSSNYRLSTVEMKLQDITMAQLLAYLHGIETSRDMLSIKRLSISKGEQKTDLINTVLQVETLEM